MASVKNVWRQIKTSDYRFQHAFADVLSFVKCQRKALGSSVDVRVIDHPLGTLSALGEGFKARIVVVQNLENVLRFFGSRQRRVSPLSRKHLCSDSATSLAR